MENVIVDEAGIEVSECEGNDEDLYEKGISVISAEPSLASSESSESSSAESSDDSRDSNGFTRSTYADDVRPGYRYGIWRCLCTFCN